MKIELHKVVQVEVANLRVCAGVRYWEPSFINGVMDEEGSLVPFRNGDNWEPVIDLATGRVVGWPEGVNADIHYKVADQGVYWLADEHGRDVAKLKSDYVPDMLCPLERGHGDYIILTIGADGLIAGWKPPALDPSDWRDAAEP